MEPSGAEEPGEDVRCWNEDEETSNRLVLSFRVLYYRSLEFPLSLASLRIATTRSVLEGEHESISRPATHSHRQHAHFRS